MNSHVDRYIIYTIVSIIIVSCVCIVIAMPDYSNTVTVKECSEMYFNLTGVSLSTEPQIRYSEKSYNRDVSVTRIQAILAKNDIYTAVSTADSRWIVSGLNDVTRRQIAAEFKTYLFGLIPMQSLEVLLERSNTLYSIIYSDAKAEYYAALDSETGMLYALVIN